MTVFGSVCSGIGAPEAAWLPLGWKSSFMSEIEPYPRAMLKHYYPDVPLHGDFTTIQAGQYEPIDVLVGGTPCQSFSIAGLRGGMADERGNLALEYLRLADRLRPQWLVWENVPGVLSSNGGRDFGAFLGGLGQLGYGFAYRVLDAQYFGLAQRRKRVFVVGCLGDWRRATEVLFEPQSLRGNSPPSRKARKSVTGTIENDIETNSVDVVSSLCANMEQGNQFALSGQFVNADISHALTAHSGRQDFETETFITIAFSHQTGGTQGMSISEELSPTLIKNQTQACLNKTGVRRLTPTECERLMGFENGKTAIPYRNGMAADEVRYKALGNSMAVPVLKWIGERIAKFN